MSSNLNNVRIGTLCDMIIELCNQMQSGTDQNSEFELLISAIASRDYSKALSSQLLSRPGYTLALYYILTYKLTPEWSRGYHASDVGLQSIIAAVSHCINKSTDLVLASYNKTGSLDHIINKHWAKPIAKKQGHCIYKLESLLDELRRVSSAMDQLRVKAAAPTKNLVMLLQGLPSREQFIFIVRWFMGDLKNGLRQKSVEQLIIEALVRHKQMSTSTSTYDGIRDKSGRVDIDSSNIHIQVKLALRALNICPDYETIFTRHGLQHEPKIGIPVRFMQLKKLTKTDPKFKQSLTHDLIIQPKFDGMRLQLHFHNGALQIYSKNGHNITGHLAELSRTIATELTQHAGHASSYILEGELAAADSRGHFLPLQRVMNRANSKGVIYRLMLFDLLHLQERKVNHTAARLVDLSLEARLQILSRHFATLNGHVRVSPSIQINKQRLTVADCVRLVDQAVAKGYEGIVLKRADSNYMPGERTYNWIGLKHGYFDSKVADSFDLVVVGLLHGTGNRSGMFGSLLLASLSNGHLDIISKCGQGFALVDIKNIYRTLEKLVQPAPDERLDVKVVSKLKNVVWVTPKIVVEIHAQRITQSTKYTIGLSLRHPVFIRVRADKSLADITKSKDIITAYKQQ